MGTFSRKKCSYFHSENRTECLLPTKPPWRLLRTQTLSVLRRTGSKWQSGQHSKSLSLTNAESTEPPAIQVKRLQSGFLTVSNFHHHDCRCVPWDKMSDVPSHHPKWGPGLTKMDHTFLKFFFQKPKDLTCPELRHQNWWKNNVVLGDTSRVAPEFPRETVLKSPLI